MFFSNSLLHCTPYDVSQPFWISFFSFKLVSEWAFTVSSLSTFSSLKRSFYSQLLRNIVSCDTKRIFRFQLSIKTISFLWYFLGCVIVYIVSCHVSWGFSPHPGLSVFKPDEQQAKFNAPVLGSISWFDENRPKIPSVTRLIFNTNKFEKRSVLVLELPARSPC